MTCPYCNNIEIYKVLFGKLDKEAKRLIENDFYIHASQIGIIPVQDDLYYCEDCKKTFVLSPENENFFLPEEELQVFYTYMRLKYIPRKVKYLIISDVPNDIYMGEAPSFFYANPDNSFYNNLYEEVITTLFFPPQFVDKTRTVGLSIEKGFRYMDKYLKKFKDRGFFQMDAVESPACMFVDDDSSRSKISKQIKDAIIRWKEYTLNHIYEVANPDTKIILVKKDVYDIYYPELSSKYQILNDCLTEKYGKPYIPSPNGRQREFRQKFYECLCYVDYAFEKDFSYIEYNDFD